MENDNYRYSTSTLQAIARNYQYIYDGLPLGGLITDPWSIAEFKGDFDTALRRIGRGHWVGLESVNFKYYRPFGRLQRIIIADIIGIRTYELMMMGFSNIPQLRGFAYYLMKLYLNGGISNAAS